MPTRPSRSTARARAAASHAPGPLAQALVAWTRLCLWAPWFVVAGAVITAVVAGGYTGLWDSAPVLYLFDVEKQTLRGSLGLPGILNHLAYSPDGRFFVGAFGGTTGIRVWDAQSGRPVAEDKKHVQEQRLNFLLNGGK